jgi:phosphatidylinositol alpha-1,6-mannosyltransferase
MARGLLVTSSFLPGRGGIESYLAELCEMVAPELAVIAPPRRDGVPLPTDLPYATFPFGRKVPWPSSAARDEIVRAAGELGVDRVLFGTPWPLILLGPALREAGLRYASIIHGAELIGPAAVPLLRRRLASAVAGADLLLPVSRYTATKVEGFLARSGSKVPAMTLLRARVDLERFRCAGDRRVTRAEVDLPVDAKIVLSFGRLVPRKGNDRLIEAMPRIRKRVPDAVLVIAGTGPESRRLERLARRHGETVLFTGRVPDHEAPAVYASADVFALAVRDRWFGLEIEGLGVVLLEAGASCVPAVTGRSGGTPEAVIDGETGFVVDDGDKDALVNRIADLLEDPERARAMGRAAREHVEGTFSGQDLPDPLSGWLGIRS